MMPLTEYEFDGAHKLRLDINLFVAFVRLRVQHLVLKYSVFLPAAFKVCLGSVAFVFGILGVKRNLGAASEDL